MLNLVVSHTADLNAVPKDEWPTKSCTAKMWALPIWWDKTPRAPWINPLFFTHWSRLGILVSLALCWGCLSERGAIATQFISYNEVWTMKLPSLSWIIHKGGKIIRGLKAYVQWMLWRWIPIPSFATPVPLHTPCFRAMCRACIFVWRRMRSCYVVLGINSLSLLIWTLYFFSQVIQ